MSGRTATLALACAMPMAMIALCGHADEQGSAIDHCAAIGNSEERIRCLEDVVRELSGIAPPAPAHGEAAVSGETPPTQVHAEPGPASAAEMPDIDDMGSEQLPGPESAETDDSDTRVTVEVVAFDFVGRNKLRMRLVNGQVWRQIDADRSDFQAMLRNQEGFIVELWKTGLGGYRMRILPTSNTIRVQRLK